MDANPGETIEDILSPQELESLRRSYDDERHDTLPLQLAVVAPGLADTLWRCRRGSS